MKRFFRKPLLTLTLFSIGAGSARAQDVILPDAKMTVAERDAYEARVKHFEAERARRHPLFLQSAKLATEALGREIMKGNVMYGIDNMYPRWKNFLAKRAGGEANINKKAQLAVKMMNDNKVVIVDFQVGHPHKLLKVNMRKKPNLPKVYYPVDFNFQTLVVVPTTTVVQMAKIDPKTGKPLRIKKNSSQIAIYDEVTTKWSFIDGSSISPNELRNLFPTMPRKFATDLPKSGNVVNQ